MKSQKGLPRAQSFCLAFPSNPTLLCLHMTPGAGAALQIHSLGPGA